MPESKKTPEGELAGQRLKAAQKLRGYDRRRLAKETGILYSTLGNYEQGTREIGIREAKRVEAVMKVPAAYLMGLVDELDMELLLLPRPVREGLLQTARAFGAVKSTNPKIEREAAPQLDEAPRVSKKEGSRAERRAAA